MTDGVIWKQLLQFAVPMAIGLLFQQFYNTVDSIVVGRFVGKEALAAVGSTGSSINMLVGICAGLSSGASVVISQCYGAHDDSKLHDAVHTTITLTFVLSVIMTVVGILIVSPMLHMMATPIDVFPEAKEYLTIYFAGVSGLLLYNMASGILRAVGDSKRPLYFLCFSAILNTVLDLLFVLVFSMRVAGVAYATILAQAISALLVLFSLTKTSAPYGIRWNRLCIRKEMLIRIMRIGLPSAIQQGVTAFSNVFVQSYINSFQSSCMAGWSSYTKIDGFVSIPMQSLALASTTFVGQNYGANKLSRARKGVKQAIIMAVSVTIFVSVLIVVFQKYLLMLFNTDQEVINYGSYFITLISPLYFTLCFNQIFAGALRGVGKARSPMVIMIASFVVFRQVYLYINKLLGNSFLVVALAYPAGWIVCSLLMTVVYANSVSTPVIKCKKAPVKKCRFAAERNAIWYTRICLP